MHQHLLCLLQMHQRLLCASLCARHGRSGVLCESAGVSHIRVCLHLWQVGAKLCLHSAHARLMHIACNLCTPHRGTWTSVTQQQQHGSRAAPGTSSVSAAPPSYSPAPHSARSSAASQPPSVCLAPAPVSILKTSGAAGTGAPGRWPLLDSAQLDAPLPAVVGAGAWRAAGLAALHASKRSVEDMGEAARRL